MFENIYLPFERRFGYNIDGNCLPRSIAVSQGYDEEHYPMIKKEILQEIENNRAYYEQLYTNQIVEWAEQVARAKDQWMGTVHLQIYSNAVEKIICLHAQAVQDGDSVISAGVSRSFFPDRWIVEEGLKELDEIIIHICWSSAKMNYHFNALLGVDYLPRDVNIVRKGPFGKIVSDFLSQRNTYGPPRTATIEKIDLDEELEPDEFTEAENTPSEILPLDSIVMTPAAVENAVVSNFGDNWVFKTPFASKDEAVAAVEKESIRNGFAVTKRRKDGTKAVLHCVCSGKYEGKEREEIARPNTATTKSNCPFRVNIRIQANGNWRANATCTFHNHPVSLETVAAYPKARRLSEEEEARIVQLHSSVKPSRIASLMNLAGPKKSLTTRDISNIIQKHKRKLMAGRSAIEFLLDELLLQNVAHKTKYEGDNLVNLLLVFEEGMNMIKQYSKVLLIDATYKTNKFNLQLVHFVGMDCFGKSYNAAFAFISEEDGSGVVKHLLALTKKLVELMIVAS